MAGAFVAVADDATATWWNPAGLASGAFFSGIVERGAASAPSDDATLGVSFVVPSLGLSYYRLRTSEIVPRLVPRRALPESAACRPFVVDEVGATFGQSIGNHVVLASTLRLVQADQTRRRHRHRRDAESSASTRVGLVVKHVHEPELTADGNRAGVVRSPGARRRRLRAAARQGDR